MHRVERPRNKQDRAQTQSLQRVARLACPVLLQAQIHQENPQNEEEESHHDCLPRDFLSVIIVRGCLPVQVSAVRVELVSLKRFREGVLAGLSVLQLEIFFRI